MKTPTPYEEAVIAKWKERVKDRAAEVDPDAQFDWYDVCFGFFLGYGFEPDRANDLASTTMQRGLL